MRRERVIRDCDGDIWVQYARGMFALPQDLNRHSDVMDEQYGLTFEEVEEDFGPVTILFEDPPVEPTHATVDAFEDGWGSGGASGVKRERTRRGLIKALEQLGLR